jgi:uncharacterized RDD family membrane protein YckC
MIAGPPPVAVPQGIGIRLAAYLIDAIAWAVPMAVILIAAGVGRRLPPARELILHTPTWFVWTSIVSQLAYFAIFEGAFATTLGKRACGLRVVTLADSSRCGWGRACLRNLLRPVDELFFWIPGVVAVIVTAHHQRIGDMVAGTAVVRFVPAAPSTLSGVAAAVPTILMPPPMPDPATAFADDDAPVLEAGWYRSQDGHAVGPLAWDALWDMALTGSLSADDLVWHESYTADWVAAHTVPELSEAFASRPPA